MAEPKPRWEGKATAEIKTATPAQVWPLLEDFAGVHKWFAGPGTSYHVGGEKGKPGMIRYCGAADPSRTGAKWAKEKLIAVDPIQLYITYQLIDSDDGLFHYVATVKVLPADGGGCCMELSFVVDPIKGWTEESLGSFLYNNLQVMAEKMEAAIMNGD